MEDGLAIVVGNSWFSLDLHHRTYSRIGYENLNDLVPVCRECHESIHYRYDREKAVQSLWDITEDLRCSTLSGVSVEIEKNPSPRPKSLEERIHLTIEVLSSRFPSLASQIKVKIRNATGNQLWNLYCSRKRMKVNKVCRILRNEDPEEE